ncbi:GAF domain-containing protein [Mastigocoleus testarum]|uniref:Phytochrome chromophore attachment site domain-containing protein n=1 Tax=Mastigocoleus testarum BC008 TaxID=371196 RepID=A0A0V7ZIF3_9CYAN|nr:GAF domain-containing protein [Mastigocoleus testarum]KST64340.1 hypothetical protein BC008_17055 [Mastigocoleus testarum BC008]KST64393.1 hypothetical protein BC008_17340 [Mastigocoleus testarum BC008]
MENLNQPERNRYIDVGLEKVLNQVNQRIERDELIIKTIKNLRELLQVDRVVLYYFYSQWHGQVIFESLSKDEYSILGSTGPDECFNNEYAAMYLQGRVRAINDIETESIHECHREFLQSLKVRANLVVPVLTVKKCLWGLLVAHHCQAVHCWSSSDIQGMKRGAEVLATSPYVSGN